MFYDFIHKWYSILQFVFQDAHSENFIDIEVNGDNFFFVQLDVPSKYKVSTCNSLRSL